MSTVKVKIYGTYRFTDKDPVIYEMQPMIEDSGMSFEAISAKSGVAPSTIANWLYGRTRRPQSATIEAVGRALGFKRVWSKVTVMPTPVKAPKKALLPVAAAKKAPRKKS